MGLQDRLVYLTVDLDYWNETPLDHAFTIIKRVLNMDIPKKIYEYHKCIVKDIPFKCHHILNIDMHDSIMATNSLQGENRKLANSNWANFIKQRSFSLYEWRHPKKTAQFCDEVNYNIEFGGELWENRDTGWKQTMHRSGLVGLPWTRTYEVSFVISEGYSTVDTLCNLLPLLNNPRIVPATKATKELIKKYCQQAKKHIGLNGKINSQQNGIALKRNYF